MKNGQGGKGSSGPKDKGGDQPKPEDKKKNERVFPFATKNKLRTEALKYDRYSATSFANFEKDLRLVAGQEFGDLFGYVIEGSMSPEDLPEPTSVESSS